jgi:hypothetical protein
MPDMAELAMSTGTGALLGQTQKILGPAIASKLRSSPIGDAVNKVGGLEVGGMKVFDNPLIRGPGEDKERYIDSRNWWNPYSWFSRMGSFKGRKGGW